jgi:zinc protease
MAARTESPLTNHPPDGGIAFPLSGVQIMRLPNGLEVLFKEDRSAPLVSVQVWVKTGSILEDRLLGTGVSHLVEHMVFQGAGAHGPGEIARRVQDTGGVLNAYTSFDRTVYWVDTLREGLETSLGVLADLTTAARFPLEEFAKEKDVIRREIDMGKDDPGRAVSQLMFSTLYREHPYREPVIGNLELFNTVEREAAFGYWQERYVPGRMFVVVVGDADAATVERLVQERFGRVEPRPSPHILLPEEPEQAGVREAHVEFPTEITRMDLAWRIPGLLDGVTPALDVLATLLGSGRTSRLWREVRARRSLAHSIGAGAYTPLLSGVFYVSAECEAGNREAVEAAVLEQLEGIRDGGVTEFTRHYLEAIDRVTPAEVAAVAGAWLRPDRRCSVSVNPKGSLRSASVRAGGLKPGAMRRHVYTNGLTLLVREDRRLPVVSLHATLRGGLLAETVETSGLGRLMARTMVKGTGQRSAELIADLIEGGGGSIGADSGGSSFSLSAQVLRPDFRDGLAVWADVLLRASYPDEEVRKEAERQAATLRQQEDHPSFVAFQGLRRAVYGEHPFAMNREGTPESLAALSGVQLRDWHRRQVVSGNTVVAVVGDVDFEEVCAAVEAELGGMPAGPRRQPAVLPLLPAHRGQEMHMVRDKRQSFLVAGYPAVDIVHPDRVALDLIDEACSDMASRFFERIREEHGLAYSVGTTQVMGMAPGVFAFYLSAAPEKAEFAKAELLQEIGLLASDGLTADELERARRTWIGKQTMQMQSSAGLAQQSALDELYGLGFDHQEKVLERVRNISREEIAEVCARYFRAEPVVVMVGPGAAGEEPA